MKHKKWILPLACCLLFAMTLPVFADVGGGVDWDFSGGGSGNSHSDGGLFEFVYLPMMLLRHPGGVGLLILIGLYYAFARRKDAPAESSTSAPPMDAPASATEHNLSQLLQRDPKFSKEAFLARAADIFVTLQMAWMNKEWKSIRAFETNQLFHQHERQLNLYLERKQTNVVEDIAILDTVFESYHEDAQHQYANVLLRARYRDYVIDDATQRVLKGDPAKRFLMTYRMQFLRKLEATTAPDAATSATSCPNCGAQLSINQNGICEYCGSEVTTGAKEWVLHALTPLHQETLS